MILFDASNRDADEPPWFRSKEVEQARERIERQATAPEARPAYPGGPLPGEQIDSDIAQGGSADDRYSTHQAPDFSEA